MSDKGLVWIIDDDPSIRWVLEKTLNQANLRTKSFDDATAIAALLEKTQPDVIITDIRMPDVDGLTLLQHVTQQCADVPVIVITAHSDLDSAVSSYEGGAFEYLPKPFDVDEVTEQVMRAIKHSQKTQVVLEEKEVIKETEMIGESPAMQEVFRAIGRLSRSNITVLINGETGTGKELVARALHRHSPRSDQPCIMINTSAIPRDLLESELFGHEKGAFTGAQIQRKGRFEQANGGTLFLDEIGDMPADLQTRLLRVLADGEFYRVGGHAPVKVDVRIIAATHQDLQKRVEAGLFREDLFHRLNVIRIYIPALRERREDIPALVSYFLNHASKELQVETKTPISEVLQYLSLLDWPGNVRQLENTCRWLTVMASGELIHIEDLPPELIENTQIQAKTDFWTEGLTNWMNLQLANGKQNLLSEALPVFETVLIQCALKYSMGHKQDAAQLLGWGRNTLTRKIKELDISYK